MPHNKSPKQNAKKTPVPDALKDSPNKASTESDSKEIAPHYDTQNRNPESNANVEIAKGSISDLSQTDSRPKG